jgi:GNAT superfamily N-acetyltransferase
VPASIALPSGFRLARVLDEPGLWEPAESLCSSVWPELMLHDPVADRCWTHLSRDWPAFQLVLVDAEGGVAAVAQAGPLCWDGTDEGLPDGWDDQFERSVADLEAGRAPDTLGAIQICVAPGRRGRSLSSLMLEAMKRSAVEAGYKAVIACVRPTAKGRYPLLSIDDYVAWLRPDGLPFDPWLRVHVRAGGRIVRPSPRSMTIRGSIAQWREWTGLDFPVSGPYVVEGALTPVEIDLAAGTGVYFDPNVWVVHNS